MAKSIKVKIKVTELNDAKLGTSAAKEIKGVEIDTGVEWSRRFFSNNKELKDQYNEIGIGDTVMCTLEQEGKYWNLKSIEEITSEKPKVTTTEIKGGSGYRTTSSGGTSRGDDTNRSAAIYLAQEFLAMSGTSSSPEALASRAAAIASNIILPFIKDGKVIDIPFEEEKKTRKKKEDSLEPPTIDS